MLSFTRFSIRHESPAPVRSLIEASTWSSFADNPEHEQVKIQTERFRRPQAVTIPGASLRSSQLNRRELGLFACQGSHWLGTSVGLSTKRWRRPRAFTLSLRDTAIMLSDCCKPLRSQNAGAGCLQDSRSRLRRWESLPSSLSDWQAGAALCGEGREGFGRRVPLRGQLAASAHFGAV